MFKSIFLLGVERGMQAISLILIAGILLRGLGDADYSRWQYAMAVFSIFSALTWFLGNEVVTVKFYRENSSKTLKFFFIIKLAICFILFIFYLLYSFFYGDEFFLYFSIFVCWIILIREPFSTFVSLYQYESRYEWVLIANILALLTRVGVIYIVIKFGISHRWLGIAWLLEVIVFIFMLYGKSNVRIRYVRRDLKISLLIFRKNFLSAAKVWVTVVSGILFLKFDKIFLSSEIGYIDYSRYSSSSQINENALSIVALTMNVLGPYYLYKFKNKFESFRKFYMMSGFIFIFLLIFSLVIFLLRDPVGRIVFGSEEYTGYLGLLIFMAPLYGVSVVFNFFFFRHEEFNHTAMKSLLLLAMVFLMYFSLKRVLSPINSVVLSLYGSLFICLLYDVYYFLRWRVVFDRLNDIE
ncbi:hypothetical protein ATN89_14405 [Comamonas thiooxydans]|uniref:hypothetical protein n=1 Tax=Comamonas thiooxydans TaxID=363952 RepID=UPI0007C4DB86|nr:hypothetical protein [Comamonas thiooxydans]OAD83643.1 hypothetical protein ATN89_14405 [Comamonas thiooxydans]